MPTITIRGRPVEIPIREELEQYDWGYRATWSDTKLIARSPFRYDTSPSFYVYLEDTNSAGAGSWGDSGAIDPFYGKGGFIRLLSFLRNEDEDSTAEYLIATYGTIGPLEDITLDLSRYRLQAKPGPLNEAMLSEYAYRHPYLESRGITEKVQRIMQIGYDKRRQAVVIPWYDASGRLRNVKYRRTDSKVFWYERGATPIRELVYGINIAYKYRKNTAILCEAEIDAMSCMVSGYCGIAVGGSHFTDKQAEIIARSPIERLYIATDNDEAGEKLRRQVIELLRGKVELYNVGLPDSINDVNDIINIGNMYQFTEIVEKAKRVNPLTLLGK